jgi:FHS family L-fucose permease-like MFS transporter
MAVPAPRLLRGATVAARAICLYVFMVGGAEAGYAAIAVGAFKSIMFPTIFSLTLERSTAGDEATSGFLCLLIIGGTFVPLVGGGGEGVTDPSGYVGSFGLPTACYALLCGFAVLAGRVKAVA